MKILKKTSSYNIDISNIESAIKKLTTHLLGLYFMNKSFSNEIANGQISWQ